MTATTMDLKELLEKTVDTDFPARDDRLHRATSDGTGGRNWAMLGEHMPPAHSAVAKRTPDWVRHQAVKVAWP
jgi:hypothetical protein